MGLFKESLRKTNIDFTSLGFKYGRGAQGEIGYVKVIYHNDDSERLWITIDTENKTLYLYNEFECGGLLWNIEVDIPNSVLSDVGEFVEWFRCRIPIELCISKEERINENNKFN